MERLERLGADHLASAVVAYRDALRSHQELINRLNVYPVPDGDTGTNMALTLESVVLELEHRGDDRPGGGHRGHQPTDRSWGRGATPASSSPRS